MGVSRWIRAIGRGLAAMGAVGVGWGLGRVEGWGEVAPALAILVGLAGVVAVEAVALIVGRLRSGTDAGPSRSLRPADGVVEILPVRGAVGEPAAAADSPWRRFVRLDPIAADEGRPAGPVAGRNPPLLGQVALISLFVGRDGRRWSPREIAEAHESLRAVGRWLEREAIARQAPLNVGLADTYFEALDDVDEPIELGYVAEGDDVGPMEADAGTKAVASASRAAAALGFEDVADMVARVGARVEADSCAWIVHVRRRGRSHAVPAGDGMIDGVGLAICYARESSFPEPLLGPARVDPTTVAHELLHLAGATDKYGVSLDRFAPGTVSRRDVMRLEVDRLGRLQVGPLTAAELGWPAAEVRPSK